MKKSLFLFVLCLIIICAFSLVACDSGSKKITADDETPANNQTSDILVPNILKNINGVTDVSYDKKSNTVYTNVENGMRGLFLNQFIFNDNISYEFYLDKDENGLKNKVDINKINLSLGINLLYIKVIYNNKEVILTISINRQEDEELSKNEIVVFADEGQMLRNVPINDGYVWVEDTQIVRKGGNYYESAYVDTTTNLITYINIFVVSNLEPIYAPVNTILSDIHLVENYSWLKGNTAVLEGSNLYNVTYQNPKNNKTYLCKVTINTNYPFTNSYVTEGITLNKLVLNDNLSWANPNEVLSLTKNEYDVKFTCDSITNYMVLKCPINVISKKLFAFDYNTYSDLDLDLEVVLGEYNYVILSWVDSGSVISNTILYNNCSLINSDLTSPMFDAFVYYDLVEDPFEFKSIGEWRNPVELSAYTLNNQFEWYSPSTLDYNGGLYSIKYYYNNIDYYVLKINIAPNPDQPLVDPYASSPSEFFKALWDSSKSIGSTQLNPETDKINIQLSMDLSLKTSDISEIFVGLNLGLVLDLASINTNNSMGDTAFKFEIFDKGSNNNLLTIWYFIQDANFIYLKVRNEYIKIGFDAYFNNELSSILAGVLKIDMKDAINNTTYLSLLNDILKTFGPNWSFDTLLMGDGHDFDGVLAAFGMDIRMILQDDLFRSLLPKNTDTSSLGSVLQAMGSIVVDNKGCKKYTEDDGSITYVSSNLSKTALALLNGFTDGLFKYVSSISSSFNVKADGSINGFTTTIKGKKNLYYLEMKINIIDFSINKTTKSSTIELEKAASYSSYAKIEWEGYFDATSWGVNIDPDLNYDTTNISIGKVLIKLDATIDLLGSKNDNKTAVQLTITNDIGGVNPEKVLTIIYKDNTLTFETDLTSNNNKAIAVEFIYPFIKSIQDNSINEENVLLYKIFVDMANEIMSEMFGNVSNPTISNVNSSFTTVTLTGIDIATLTKGAFYSIIGGFITGSIDEKPGIPVTELTNWDFDTYLYKNKEYSDSQYAWSLDILELVTTLLKTSKYSGESSELAKDGDYSIEFIYIAKTILDLFKNANLRSVDGSYSANVREPANVNELMALLVCTNDKVLLDLTRHGLLPLYDPYVGITNMYISSTTSGNKVTEEYAINNNYYAISGKMISKDDAIALWNFLLHNSSLNLSIQSNNVGEYYNIDGDVNKDTLYNYIDNSFINKFFKYFNGTTLINGMSPKYFINNLTGSNSGISISINRKTGNITFGIKLDGESATGYIKCSIKGADTAFIPTISPVATTSSTSVTFELDNNFYSLFKAQNGMGPTTLNSGSGVNTDLYYIASYVNYSSEMSYYTDIAYTNQAIFFAQNGNNIVAYFIDVDGTISPCSAFVFSNNDTVLTINNSIVYDVYGDTYKVIVER